ncbi:MAG: GNAT family N-acetyltransferase [Candidatus Corynebacterium faecigallinarum]|uniref:GNAT family N-acetyltransferase n=1 Tax=Corynebacterium TaxID=1716 RepID=UPI0034629F90
MRRWWTGPRSWWTSRFWTVGSSAGWSPGSIRRTRWGEVHVIVVDPEVQRQGIASVLLDRSHQRIREAGMRMVMVETGDDPGHAPARSVYRANGYKRWPVARYFKDLTG